MAGQDHTIHIEAPETPDFGPQITSIRERLARLEERTESPHTDPAVAESLSLASEAHRTAQELRDRLAALERSADDQRKLALEKAAEVADEITEIAPPAAIENPISPDPEIPSANHERHQPWWHPERYL